MRILVTGGTGFIGSRVVRQLLCHPDVEVVILTTGSDPWRLRRCGVLPRSPELQVVSGNFAQPEIDTILEAVQPQVIVHLAMVYHKLGSVGGDDVQAVNCEGTLRLFDAFLRVGGRRFINAGTCFEYGHQAADLIDETAECWPIYDYAVAKARATEALLKRARQTGTEALVLRVFAPYGPMEDPQRIVPQLLQAGGSGQALALSPGEQVRDYVHVDDTAAAFVTAALHPALPRPQAIYNVCTAIGCSLRSLAAKVERVLGRPLRLDWGRLSYRPNEMMRLVGANERIGAELGWRPAIALDDGLTRVAAKLAA